MDDETLRRVQRTLERIGFRADSDDIIRERLAHIVAFQQPVLPDSTETAAIALKSPKTAALCFDRVWGYPDPRGSGKALFFHGGTDFEFEFAVVTQIAEDIIAYHDAHPSVLSEEKAADLAFELHRALFSTGSSGLPSVPEDLLVGVPRRIASALLRDRGWHVPLLFDATADPRRNYRSGDIASIYALLEGAKVVDEEALTWDQIEEFRRDDESRRKFRRLIHWLDASMSDKTLAFVQDELAIRLEDYDKAIRKHGLRVVLGSLSSLLDSRFLAGGAFAAAAAKVIAGDIAALSTAAALSVGQATLHLATTLLDLEEKRENSGREIAFVIAARQLTQ